MNLFKNLKNLLLTISAAAILSACGGGNDTYYPKPRGFFRINLPEKKYIEYDSLYPFSFRIPVYSKLEPLESEETGVYWFNLLFPAFHGSVNFSYKPVKDNLYQMSEDAREFANKHIAKANEIQEMRISYSDNDVYGISYSIDGTNSASPYQFFVTDSSKHYLRAAVYFNHIPNNDSIAPIIQRVKEDLDTMLVSLKWK